MNPCVVFPKQHASLEELPPTKSAANAQQEFKSGLALAKTGKHQEALQAYSAALQSDPAHGLTHLFKAESHLYTDNDVEAMRKHLSLAILLMPNNPRAHHRFADFSADNGDSEAALRHWRCALDRKPGLDDARLRLAQQLYSEQKLDKAKEHLQPLLQAQPDVRTLVLASQIHAAEGEMFKAAKDMERAAEVAGESAALLRRAADLYERAESPLSARRARGRADRIDPPKERRKMRPLRKRKRRRRRRR